VKDAKVAVFACSIQCTDTETKGTILLESASDLLSYNIGEEKEIEKIIRDIHDSGVRVVITGGTVDDMAAHFLEKYGLMTLKVTSKHDLRRISKACKARALMTLGGVDPEFQGFVSNVFVKEIGSQKVTIFQHDRIDSTSVATVLLRASTHNILNDVERAVDDGVNVIRQIGKDGRFVPGAGAADIELARQLAVVGARTPGLEQYAIKKFAEALEVVPRTLAENAGAVAIDTIAALYAAHERGETKVGVNVEEGGVKDVGVLDLLATKSQAMRLAIDAVLTVLRVDQIIVAKPAGGPKLPQKSGNWDED